MSNHASHAALPYPIKGCRYTIPVPYLAGDGTPTDPTTPDTEISIDGGSFADCTEEAGTITGGAGNCLLTLTGDETNCSLVWVQAKAASGPKTTLLAFSPRVLPIVVSGTCQAGANGSITLAANAPAYDLTGCIVRTTGGTGGGGGSGSAGNQARVITAYDTSTKVATVVPNWETNPAAGGTPTTYEVLATESWCSTAKIVNAAGTAMKSDMGYVDAAVWVKAAGTSGTTSYVNGTAENPCPWADAQTIAAALNLTRFRIATGETVTLTGACTGKTLIGKNWSLALGGQSISGSYFEGATVNGIGTVGAGVRPAFVDCDLVAVTIPPSRLYHCGIGGDDVVFHAGSAGRYDFVDCYNVSTATSEISFAGLGAPTIAEFIRWGGGSTITLDANCTMRMDAVSPRFHYLNTAGATADYQGSFKGIYITTTGSSHIGIRGVVGPVEISGAGTGATVTINGVCSSVTDTSTGTTIVNDAAIPTVSQIADAVWGAATTALTVTGSIGKWIIDKLTWIGLKVGAYTTGPSIVIQPVNEAQDAITLVRGDDYTTASGRTISFSDPGDWPAWLSDGGTVITLTVKDSAGTEILSVVGAVVGGTDPLEIEFQPTHTETDSMPPGTDHVFDVQAEADDEPGTIRTLILPGQCIVLEDVTRPE